MNIFRVIDFETTNLPENDPEAGICEIGFTDVRLTDQRKAHVEINYHAQLVNCGRPIPPEVEAIHHISAAMLDSPGILIADMVFDTLTKSLPLMDCFVAHNAAYEQQFFCPVGVPWICTYKVALRMWPEAPGFGNQTLRYWRNLLRGDQRAMPPHRAGPDSFVTAYILAEMLNAEDGPSPEQMVEWSSAPAYLVNTKVGFGKHKGAIWRDLPQDYLWWIVNKSDFDADTKWNARQCMKKAGDR